MNVPARIAAPLSILAILALPGQALDYPGPYPGPAEAKVEGGELSLSNSVISCDWRVANGKLEPVRVTDRLSGKSIDLVGAEAFRMTLSDGRTIAATNLKVTDDPSAENLPPAPGQSNLAHRFPGRQLTVRLASDDGQLDVTWRAVLRDGANAVRQEIAFTARKTGLPVTDIALIDIPASGAQVAGTVPGSPLVLGNLFLAYEHPDAVGQIGDSGPDARAQCVLSIDASLAPDETFIQSSAVGVVPDGQLRRGFLYYIERERAHPYQPFLHYNSWYDISWANIKFREEECLAVVEGYGRELIQTRGVPMASLVWDDGWDDPKTLWRAVEENFPNGFTKILDAARGYDTTLGFWLSPCGGYGDAAKDRYTYGKEQGFEFKDDRFALAGPQYYARFKETCARMIEVNGANFFKFDGLTRDVAETEAMLRLTRELRGLRRDLFISITTGTWPSPYWLWYGDSTWRGERDMGFEGTGPKREQWVTYRDAVTYHNVVRRAPLYPLNSLMNQGIAHAKHGPASEIGNSREEMRNEIRSFFACGTNLQELYISPDLLTTENWDDLADAARWSHANADVLVDTHWIGGDPKAGEPYGWASWTKRKGILSLRNPSLESKTIAIDVQDAFELPPGAATCYKLEDPWTMHTNTSALELEAGKVHTFELAPFDVLVFDAMPSD